MRGDVVYTKQEMPHKQVGYGFPGHRSSLWECTGVVKDGFTGCTGW